MAKSFLLVTPYVELPDFQHTSTAMTEALSVVHTILFAGKPPARSFVEVYCCLLNNGSLLNGKGSLAQNGFQLQCRVTKES